MKVLLARLMPSTEQRAIAFPLTRLVQAFLREVMATKLAQLIGVRTLATPDNRMAICNIVLTKFHISCAKDISNEPST